MLYPTELRARRNEVSEVAEKGKSAEVVLFGKFFAGFVLHLLVGADKMS